MSSWDEVVSAALVGVRSRPISTRDADPVITPHLPDEVADPAVTALQIAALRAAARSASGPPTIAAEPIPTAPDDPRPRISDQIADNLDRAMILSPHLELWCFDLLARSGVRPPARMLPTLLARTSRKVEIRPAVSAFVGPRGRWLAEQVPELRAVLDSAATLTDTTDSSVWTHGDPDERAAYLRSLRERDPDTARELLEAAWGTEDGPSRELLLPILARTPSAADEGLLERALDDRRAKVRAAAADILDHIDGSAHQVRITAAASALLSLTEERQLLRRRPSLQAALPIEPDAALGRDGITLSVPPNAKHGVGAYVLAQLVSRVRPSFWESRFGMTPDQIVEAIEPDQGPLVIGLSHAAVTFDDERWATALLGHPDSLPKVVATADPRVVARKFDELPADRRLEALRALPTPWPENIARTALRLLEHSIVGTARTGLLGEVFDLMAVGLPATDEWRDAVRMVRASPHAETARAQFARLSESIRIRIVLTREFQ